MVCGSCSHARTSLLEAVMSPSISGGCSTQMPGEGCRSIKAKALSRHKAPGAVVLHRLGVRVVEVFKGVDFGVLGGYDEDVYID